MRLHTAAAAYVLFFAGFLGLTRGEYALLFAVIGIMITAEGFNTAIEKLSDFSCKNHDRRIGAIKDISAGAVLISALSAVCVGLVILWRPKELGALILAIWGSPLYLVLLAVTLLLSLIYVVYGPAGIKIRVYRIFKRKP